MINSEVKFSNKRKKTLQNVKLTFLFILYNKFSLFSLRKTKYLIKT